MNVVPSRSSDRSRPKRAMRTPQARAYARSVKTLINVLEVDSLWAVLYSTAVVSFALIRTRVLVLYQVPMCVYEPSSYVSYEYSSRDGIWISYT